MVPGFHREWYELFSSHPRVVLVAPVEHAKTSAAAVIQTIFDLGQDPGLRCAVISSAQNQAVKVLSSIKQNIKDNPRVRMVFPHLLPGDKWHEHAITVERDTIAKDPSVQALGAGSAVLGSRLDRVVIDDINDFENTRTQEQMQKTVDYADSSVLTRLTEDGRVRFIGTPWSLEDSLHVFEKRPGWVSRRYSAVLNPNDPPTSWIPLWPEQFSVERLRKISAEQTPNNFARNYLCQVKNDQTSRFQEAWIQRCLDNGRGRAFMQQAPVTGGGKRLPCFTGVDLGIGQTEKHDLTVLFTVAVDEQGRLWVVDIESGRWPGAEIVQRIGDKHRRFGSVILVEDNGAQSFLVQWCARAGIPVKNWTTTGRNKYDESFGVESLAVEVRSGLWVFPSGRDGSQVPDEMRAAIREMFFFTPGAHTGDRLMAMWIAREGARQAMHSIGARVDTLAR